MKTSDLLRRTGVTPRWRAFGLTTALAGALVGCVGQTDSGVGTAEGLPEGASGPPLSEMVYMGRAHIASPEEAAAYDARFTLQLPPDEHGGVGVVEERGLEEGTSPWVRIDPETGEMFEEVLNASAMAAIEAAAPGGVRDTAGWLAEDTEGVSLALVRGDDDRRPRSSYNGYNMRSYPWRAVGSLTPIGQSSTNRSVSCTATKVGPRLLLTAAHCVWDRDNDTLVPRRFRPGADGLAQLNGDSIVPNGIKKIEHYFVDDDYIRWGGAWNDWALLVLEDAADTVSLGWFGRKVDWALLNDTVHNLGYPGSTQECDGAPAAANGRCYGSMYHESCRVTNTTARTVYYDCDTTGGHSGGPVYKFESGDRKIVAAVYGSSGPFNLGARMTNELYDAISLRNAQYPTEF